MSLAHGRSRRFVRGRRHKAVAYDNSRLHTVIMIRTQISLSREDYVAAKREAARMGVSLAEYFRRALKAALPAEGEKPWMSFAGMVESGEPDAGAALDDLVYGRDC